jgi:uncharacterized membrane protein YphA (DoxX/SURF4 family)
MKYAILIARLLIGGLFVYASFHKILDPAAFAKAVRNYQMLPVEVTNLVALVLPWIEILVGMLLILGIQTKPSALIASCLIAIFLVGLYRAYFTGLDIECGCFSTDPLSAGRISLLTLVRDSVLLPVSLMILIADRGNFSLPILGERPV